MTRQEASGQIGQREFSVGEILRLSADLFFENIGKWLLLCAIVYFPTSFIVQYVALQLPVDEVYNTLMQGDLYAITQLDWTPYLIYYGVQIGMSLIWLLTNLAAAIYADRWLQADRSAYRFGEMMKAAVRRWPAGMLVAVLLFLLILVLITMSMFVGYSVLPLLMILMVVAVLILIALYYTALSATAIRQKTGPAAYRYASMVIRRKIGKTIGLTLLLMVIQMGLSYLLEIFTSSFGVLASNPILLCLVAALVNVIASLSTVFLSLGITIYFINQEQIGPMAARPQNPWELPGGF